MASSTNSWLRAQRKSDLVELADSVGLRNYDGLRKTELESALDDFIAEHSSRFAHRSDLAGYFHSRSKALGSPLKREVRETRETIKDEADKGLRVARRRAIKAVDEASSPSSSSRNGDDEARASSTSLVQTPGRSLSSQVVARIPLPATPADVAQAVDRSTQAVRRRVSSIYQESGITEASHATRQTLSTVTSILFCVSAFELFYIRAEILANRFAFTIPALGFLGTPDYPVYLPDMFLLVTAGFWSPALTWVLTSFVLPTLSGYFFNLTATSGSNGQQRTTRSRASAQQPAIIDPLTFSIAKALASYLVYAEGATFAGLLSEASIARLNSAVYGGYKGILVGTAITGLVSIYDAVLRK